MAGHESNITSFLPNWVNSTETQSLLMTAALIMIAWLVLSWIIQTVITLLWPISVGLLLIVLFLPDTAQWLFHDFLPPYMAAFKVWATTVYVQANSTMHTLNQNRNPTGCQAQLTPEEQAVVSGVTFAMLIASLLPIMWLIHPSLVLSLPVMIALMIMSILSPGLVIFTLQDVRMLVTASSDDTYSLLETTPTMQ